MTSSRFGTGIPELRAAVAIAALTH